MGKIKDLLPTKDLQEELERIISLAKGIKRSSDSDESRINSELESEMDFEEKEEEIVRLEAACPASLPGRASLALVLIAPGYAHH